MATKRMFSNKVVDTDQFTAMSAGPQSLYYKFGMYTDDDGFVSRVKRCMEDAGATKDDLFILVARGFIYSFGDPPEAGPVLIRHHLVNNTLKNDRYEPTIHQLEKAQIITQGKVFYHKDDPSLKFIGESFQNGSKKVPQLNGTELNGTNGVPKLPGKETHELGVPIGRETYNSLCERYGKSVTDSFIQKVVDYSESRGKRYADYAATARQWMRKDETEGKLHPYQRAERPPRIYGDLPDAADVATT